MADEIAALTRNIEQLVFQMGQEGVLDDQFLQLLQLQDESNPDFVQELVVLYFEDGASKLEKLEAKLTEAIPDFNEVDQLVHQFKGSSSSFGAQRIAQLCVQLRECCQSGDRNYAVQLLHQTREQFSLLKSRLDIFTQLETRKKELQRGGSG